MMRTLSWRRIQVCRRNMLWDICLRQSADKWL